VAQYQILRIQWTMASSGSPPLVGSFITFTSNRLDGSVELPCPAGGAPLARPVDRANSGTAVPKLASNANQREQLRRARMTVDLLGAAIPRPADAISPRLGF
jgi:hypothetical protein